MSASQEAELRKLRRINEVLMNRVERDMDAQGGTAFSLFQTAITLERRVFERTAELTRLTQRLMQEVSERCEAEAALQIAKAQAEQANLSKTRFLAAASHDLHQPLNAARLFLGALADEVGDGRPRALIGRIESALDSVTELLAALIDIGRLDTGAWPVAPSAFPIADVLAQLADEYAPQAAARGLALRVMPSRAVVRTDRMLLLRLLRNLLSNAIRYTPAGRVLVGCRRDGPDAVRVEVWDTGTGIPEDKRAQIFEEFQRLQAPPGQHERGYGLGLAIVERIARLLSLPLVLRSRPGHGSCFAVTVGIGDGGADAAETEAPHAAGHALAGLRIACLDNDAGTLDALEAVLRGWDCRTAVGTTTEALLAASIAADLVPDLIIVDYHLDDGARGTQAVAMLRARFGRTIPAVIVSGDRAPCLREEAAALGCGFLPKPVQPAKLRAMISYVLDAAPAAT